MSDEPEAYIESVDHQFLIEELTLLCLQEVVTKHFAERVIAYFIDNYPGCGFLDEAVLLQIKREHGLTNEEPLAFFNAARLEYTDELGYTRCNLPHSCR